VVGFGRSSAGNAWRWPGGQAGRSRSGVPFAKYFVVSQDTAGTHASDPEQRGTGARCGLSTSPGAVRIAFLVLVTIACAAEPARRPPPVASNPAGGWSGARQWGKGREAYRPRWPQATALHRAVREGWAAVDAQATEGNGLPRRIRQEVQRYLACGDVRRGFAQAKCDACQQSTLVAFSCKQRGLCPSCGARRSHEAALHCEEVLPEAAYRGGRTAAMKVRSTMRPERSQARIAHARIRTALARRSGTGIQLDLLLLKGDSMKHRLRLFMLVQATTLIAAALIHRGVLLPGHEHRQASVAESVIAIVLLIGVTASWIRPESIRTIAIAAQGFALLGTLVGIATIMIGIGPRTVPDVAYHVLLVGLLLAGLIAAGRTREGAR
jgi:hypothetical protein